MVGWPTGRWLVCKSIVTTETQNADFSFYLKVHN